MAEQQHPVPATEHAITPNGSMPQLPAKFRDREIPLTDNARKVLHRRYIRTDIHGNEVETEQEMFWRVAWYVAEAEDVLEGDRQQWAEQFFDMLTKLEFLPNSPTFTGAGTPLGQLAACFVLPIEDDMGKVDGGIFDTLKNAALIQQTGGGNGFAFSRLRPAGAPVHSSSGIATGPVGFLNVYDKAFGEIAQGGTRRGANMAVLRVDHPDIRDFIKCKAQEGDIENFNISVGATDTFMRAVANGEDYELVNPQDGEVWDTVNARELFDDIVKHAHRNGEPGMLFLDAANRENPVPHLYELEATNPCVTGDTLVATPAGWRRVDEIDVGDEIYTIDGIGTVDEIEVNHAMPVYLVQFSDGASIRATASHQFHVLGPNDNIFRPRRLDTLEAGDRVRVRRPEPMPIHTLETLPVDGVHYVESGSYLDAVEENTATIVSITRVGRETVYDLYESETDTWITAGYVSRGCGEQWLGPYENCCLGSINLSRHVVWEDETAHIDWHKLAATARTATRFLDDVVTSNKYVPAVPELREAAERARRIGLGIMGLADVLYAMRVRYGSDEGQELAAQLMEWVRYHSMLESIELSDERGPFEAIDGSIYDPDDITWQPPTPLEPYKHDWGRPQVKWNTVLKGIKKHGIRNAAQTTVAPTGTLSTVSGVEGYGCEPVFALAYVRHVHEGDETLDLMYTSPLFDQALAQAGFSEEERHDIAETVSQHGTCQDVEAVPAELRDVFVVSSDITPKEHVRMQAALQAFVDNSLSKTINFPETATVNDVAEAYQLAWELGCKGITVYVTGSREKVVLETKKTMDEKQAESGETGQSAQVPAYAAANGDEKPRKRPRHLDGSTYFTQTPLGKAYVTVNRDTDGEPFEVFANVGKAGSDIAAVSEAIGRLISYILRLPSPISPTERLKLVQEQLTGIGGGRHLGFGANRILSLPDALAQVLKEDLVAHSEDAELINPGGQVNGKIEQQELFQGMLKADLCPECGHASLVNEEGCRKCYSCGFSEC